MDDILQQLPDERATQRLLGVLDKLEKHLVAQRRGAVAEANTELKKLREENLSLRFRQSKARDKLDTLLERLPGLFPELLDKPGKNKEAA